MEDLKLYELTNSQEVVMLQCKYTLFKRVINIITSMSTKEELDFDLMKKALNIVIERNDCLRLRFVKKKGKMMQYFLKEDKIEQVPILEFKTAQEQDAFVKNLRKSAIKYMQGKVIEPYFIKTFDGKYMVLLKVCHLVLDIYGLNVIYKDLFAVYNSLKNNQDLPEAPIPFEAVVKHEVVKKNNKENHQKNLEFFTKLLQEREEPYYAGLHGNNNSIWQKQLKKNKRAMKMFFINCDTEGYIHNIDKETTKKVFAYCEKVKQSPANFLFFALSVTAGRLNNNTDKMLPLELYNCRTNYETKNCAGTKVQSLGCYTTLDYNKTFQENFDKFCADQRRLYRYIGFADMEFEQLLHKSYKSSMLETYYSLTYSFIPYELSEDLNFEIYSNGKCALPAYLAQFYNVKTGEMAMAYDCQTKIISEQGIADFHKKYLKVLNTIIERPEMN